MMQPLAARSVAHAHWLAPGTALGVVLSLIGCSGPLLTAPTTLGLAQAGDEPAAVDELPDDLAADACRQTAAELESAGHWPQAIRLYERSLVKDANQPELLHRLAVLHHRTGNVDRAAARYEEALEQRDPPPALMNDYGYFLIREGDPADAIEWLSLAAESDPENRRFAANLAHALVASGQVEDGLAAYEALVGEAAAYANVGAIAARRGETAVARKALEVAQQLDPSLPQPPALLAALDRQSATR